MPAPGFLSDVALWPWYLPYAENRTVTLDFADGNGDPTDPGVVTVDAGAAWNVHATVTGSGTSRAVTWSTVQTVALADGGILGGKWRLRIDGVYKMGGPIRASSPTVAPTAGEWTIQLPAPGDGLTITVAAGGSARQDVASPLAMLKLPTTDGHVYLGGVGDSGLGLAVPLVGWDGATFTLDTASAVEIWMHIADVSTAHHDLDTDAYGAHWTIAYFDGDDLPHILDQDFTRIPAPGDPEIAGVFDMRSVRVLEAGTYVLKVAVGARSVDPFTAPGTVDITIDSPDGSQPYLPDYGLFNDQVSFLMVRPVGAVAWSDPID